MLGWGILLLSIFPHGAKSITEDLIAPNSFYVKKNYDGCMTATKERLKDSRRETQTESERVSKTKRERRVTGT